jgi:toxin CptA
VQFPITIGLRRSFFGLAGVAAVHGLAATALLATSWPFWLKCMALAGLAAAAVLPWRAGAPKADAIRLLGDGRMECRLTGGDEFLVAELMSGATVHPWITAIRLKVASATLSVVFFPDSTNPEDFRRLRVWLRWRADFSAGKGAD